MEVCNKHDDCVVQHDGKVCPVCRELAELEDAIYDLNEYM